MGNRSIARIGKLFINISTQGLTVLTKRDITCFVNETGAGNGWPDIANTSQKSKRNKVKQ